MTARSSVKSEASSVAKDVGPETSLVEELHLEKVCPFGSLGVEIVEELDPHIPMRSSTTSLDSVKMPDPPVKTPDSVKTRQVKLGDAKVQPIVPSEPNGGVAETKTFTKEPKLARGMTRAMARGTLMERDICQFTVHARRTDGTESACSVYAPPAVQPPCYRPKRVILVRHGESEANVNRTLTQEVPDHAVHLTGRGREEALDAGVRLRQIIGDDTVAFICSPYVRARETLNGVTRAWKEAGEYEDPVMREDVQIREQDFGNFDRPDMRELHCEKGIFGQFYYRFPEGESLADVYDRASLFLESLYRRWEFSREHNLVIVTHGLFILIFVMRLFRYSVEEFYDLDPPKNCELIVLERPEDASFYDIGFTWAPKQEPTRNGLRKRPPGHQNAAKKIVVWDGDPKAELLVSHTFRPKGCHRHGSSPTARLPIASLPGPDDCPDPTIA